MLKNVQITIVQTKCSIDHLPDLSEAQWMLSACNTQSRGLYQYVVSDSTCCACVWAAAGIKMYTFNIASKLMFV